MEILDINNWKKYNMGSHTPIVEWVKTYKSQRREGLKRRKTQREYFVKSKLDIIQLS